MILLSEGKGRVCADILFEFEVKTIFLLLLFGAEVGDYRVAVSVGNVGED